MNRLGQQRAIMNLSGDAYIGKELPTQNQIELRYLSPIHVVGFRTKPAPAQAFQQGLLVLQPQGYLELTALIELSPMVLDRIEQLREGGDLILAIYLKVWWQQKVTTLPVSHAGRPFIRIAKSDWAERILKKAGYTEVTVIELPEPVDVPELRNAIDYLRSAWRSYRIGEYYDAVINVRRALDSLVDGLKNYNPNLVAERVENNRKIEEPNFKALAKTDTEADSITRIYKSLRSIGGLSAHQGAIHVDKQLAELSIIVGQAILRYVTKRIKGSGQ
ncbi:hypothetical protein Pdsh_03130 [Pyrodictium delaneyi]|uniref:DUF4145 domain-containing protein n=1 Tax=Pyrodictium delaneyi TaxID=1273541 RepID=A0A211YP58_9CREN|nr:hypothetical protein Pdsh_03130 [Pyrodictium delaneyi]